MYKHSLLYTIFNSHFMSNSKYYYSLFCSINIDLDMTNISIFFGPNVFNKLIAALTVEPVVNTSSIMSTFLFFNDSLSDNAKYLFMFCLSSDERSACLTYLVLINRCLIGRLIYLNISFT